MVLSRVLPFAVSATRSSLGSQSGRKMFSTTAKMSSGGASTYRCYAPLNPRHELYANCCGAFMWWWVFWHLMTDYEHIIGHFEFPDQKSWTDAELGIPPLDAEDPDIE